ncbi:hypothetical protein HMPREF1139_2177 [Campylobacter sp. FOBRC14]|nr:hypothetical protein HMPREF1139_2177 [Campylobacter sp. FOBRC14]
MKFKNQYFVAIKPKISISKTSIHAPPKLTQRKTSISYL